MSDDTMREELKGKRHPLERAIVVSLFIAGALSIAVTVGILWELGKESLLFLGDDEV
jgi:ABC-type phosphate transport system permease subunit